MTTEKITTQDDFYEEKLAELSEGLDLDKAYKDFCEAEDHQATGILVPFQTFPIPGNPRTPDLHVDAGLDKTSEHSYKMIYHIQNASQKVAEEIGKVLQDFAVKYLHPLESDVFCQFSPNPMFRSTWDFLVWNVPALRANELHRLALQAITGVYGGH